MTTTAPRPRPIKFCCPTCGHLLRAAEAMVGRQSACPLCNRPLTVPYPHALPDPHGDAPTLPELPALCRGE